MTVLLDRALLENNGDATDVHYEDQSCVGYDYTGSRIAVTTRYDDCDTVSEQTADVIKYSNVVTYFKPTGENGSLITRDFRLKIPVTCEIKRRSLLGSSFKPKLGIVSFSETGYGNFSLTLDRYSDISFTSPAPDPDSLVYLGETLFFGVTLDAVSDLTLFLDRCWATPDVYPMNPIEFTFVKDGCGLDPTVGFHDIQRLIKGFSIDAFAFIGEYSEVYLHCDVLVCDTDPASRCSQGCVTRAKRSAAGQPRGSSSKPHTISNGPMSDQVAVGSSSMNTSWLANPFNMMLVAAAGFFITMVAMVTVKKLRSHTKASKGYSRLQTEGEIEA
ncbi:ZP domain-containing protein-like [Strongylocentrotus purpuratus]|uniref:ZP domain-containing protein n=1 Tax=Strongylocentrotus purpuratus TaxID=7668 RepID=A0A7M7N9F5_STRPU|nr:ZP domain-containing protein-like [Strongylocentrotus purpuratus]